MPDDRHVPKGLPPNPLTGRPMDQLLRPYPLPSAAWHAQPPMETFRPPMMENPGITNTAGMASKGQPEIMTVPSPVSATDPAYSMHPIVTALGSSLGGFTAPNFYPSTFMQMPLSGRRISKSDLITALGLPGLGGNTQTQGATIDGG